MAKRRVLFIGEASFLATGFSTYWNEVLRRIHAMDLFEIAELGSYASEADPRCRSLPWKFYPVMPDTNNAEAMQRYNSSVTNQFGEAVFGNACLDWHPDIVCGIRDWWMDEFVFRSPFRKHFKFVWMPTVDGAPQRLQWMDDYKRVDALLTYSEFGKRIIEGQSKGKLTVKAIASPGVDFNTFKPIADRSKHKQMSGIRPDAFIVGTVMRNQSRKLYYDLIEAFALWCKQMSERGHKKLVDRTYLYLHTSYPDVGYDIGAAINEFGVGNRVLMSYLCNECGITFPSLFSGEWCACKQCKKVAAHPPNTTQYCSRPVLAHVMNLFDAYVQYSICWAAGSRVRMSDNTYKPIETVCRGDKVITHDGKTQTVTEVFENPSLSKRSIDIKLFGDNRSYKCTDNHPIWTKDRGWVRADELRTPSMKPRIQGDWVGQPIPILGSTNQFPCDPYILGVLLGDGWIEKSGRIGVSLGNNKKRAIKAIREIVPSSVIGRIRNGTSTEITWLDEDLSKLLLKYIGHKAQNKRLPSKVFQSTPIYVAKVLRGLFDTDGGKSIDDTRFYTSSEQLADQVRLLLASVGIVSSIHKSSRRETEYTVIIKGKKSLSLWELIRKKDPPPDVGESPSNRDVFMRIEDGYLWCKIKGITPTVIDGKIYNLEVESKGGDAQSSHSYVVGSIACHNCEGWG